MNNKKQCEEWPLFRIIIPAFPEINIYTRIANKTTSLGSIMVATVADKLWGCRVEIIDENNTRKIARDINGNIDHAVLQKQRPAAVIGFYCGLSSTMERVWKLADFYKSQGIFTLAGGWHTDYLPEESLNRGIDLIIHGDAEMVIRKILGRIKRGSSFDDICGVSFIKDGKVITNSFSQKSVRIEIDNLDNLPFPDFGLIRNAKIKIYPIGRVRGCSKNCEFCSVRGDSRWSSAKHLFDTVDFLVETRKAKDFFIVDDRVNEDRQGTIDFFNMVAEKYGRSLEFTVQIRLESARDKKLLESMKRGGAREVCIGYESPIDEELKAMNKGYLSKDMLSWTKVYHDYGFQVHGMFIFGYPNSLIKISLSADERMKRFKEFINKAALDTIQVLKTVPLPGTPLRNRLKNEGKLFSLEEVSWRYYDGSYVCYKPSDMTIEELQEIPIKIMKSFYHWRNFLKIVFRTLVMPFDYMMRGWPVWYKGWRNDVKRSGGYIILNRWVKKHRQKQYLTMLKK